MKEAVGVVEVGRGHAFGACLHQSGRYVCGREQCRRGQAGKGNSPKRRARRRSWFGKQATTDFSRYKRNRWLGTTMYIPLSFYFFLLGLYKVG